MKRLLIVLLGLSSISLHAQTRVDISSVHTLDVTDKLNVVLVPSDDNYISIEGEQEDKVEVIQRNGKLRVKMTGVNVLQGGSTFVKVHTQGIHNFVVQKGAIVQANGNVISAESIDVKASEGARLDIAVKTQVLDVSSSTGANVEMRGEADKQDINVKMGGSFFGDKLKSKHAVVGTSAGGRADVYASESVDVKIRAGGLVNVYGKPADRKEKKVAGGKVVFFD